VKSWVNVAATFALTFTTHELVAGDMNVTVSIRYLQIRGTSYAHIYLYSGQGALIRPLTAGSEGQDVDPIFAPDGREVVFTRKLKKGHEVWAVQTSGANLHVLSSKPAWYRPDADETPRFTSLTMEWETWYKNLPDPAIGATPQPSPTSTPPLARLVAPDESIELILDRNAAAEQNYDNSQRGKLYRLRDRKTGHESLIREWPGFETLWDPLHLRGNEDWYFLFEPPLKTIFFFVHLNSTDGDTVYALDLNDQKVVRLSPNYATPIPFDGDPSFFTVTEERYLPLGDGKRTVNCSYLDRWDAGFHRTRFGRSVPAIFGGASVFRRNHPPLIIRRNLD